MDLSICIMQPAFPLPEYGAIIKLLGDEKILTVLNIKAAFFNIPVLKIL